jgi:hypothetical protein
MYKYGTEEGVTMYIYSRSEFDSCKKDMCNQTKLNILMKDELDWHETGCSEFVLVQEESLA